MNVVQVIGVNEIKEALMAADLRQAFFIRRGMLKAGLMLQRASQQIVPIDTGNLKRSAGTKVIGQGWASEVIVYYTAAYAVYVHEMTWLRHKEGKQAKFLERPAREMRQELLAVIAAESRLLGGTE